MVKVRAPQDLLAGLLFAAFGIAALWFGQDYPVGTLWRMGPGFVPRALAFGLIGFGLILVVRGISFDGEPVSPGRWRPVIVILLSVILFAVLLERVGLIVTTLAVTGLAAFAHRDGVRPLESVLLAVLLTVLSVGLFVFALGQQIPIGWWS
jgi:hypothetical protein